MDSLDRFDINAALLLLMGSKQDLASVALKFKALSARIAEEGAVPVFQTDKLTVCTAELTEKVDVVREKTAAFLEDFNRIFPDEGDTVPCLDMLVAYAYAVKVLQFTDFVLKCEVLVKKFKNSLLDVNEFVEYLVNFTGVGGFPEISQEFSKCVDFVKDHRVPSCVGKGCKGESFNPTTQFRGAV